MSRQQDGIMVFNQVTASGDDIGKLALKSSEIKRVQPHEDGTLKLTLYSNVGSWSGSGALSNEVIFVEGDFGRVVRDWAFQISSQYFNYIGGKGAPEDE